MYLWSHLFFLCIAFSLSLDYFRCTVFARFVHHLAHLDPPVIPRCNSLCASLNIVAYDTMLLRYYYNPLRQLQLEFITAFLGINRCLQAVVGLVESGNKMDYWAHN